MSVYRQGWVDETQVLTYSQLPPPGRYGRPPLLAADARALVGCVRAELQQVRDEIEQLEEQGNAYGARIMFFAVVSVLSVVINVCLLISMIFMGG